MSYHKMPCPKCGGHNFNPFDDCSGMDCQSCGYFIPDGEINPMEEKYVVSVDGRFDRCNYCGEDDSMSDVIHHTSTCKVTLWNKKRGIIIK